MHEERYNAVLSACALLVDLENLSHGDQTQVGPRGMTLSGGQQARLALARALYQVICAPFVLFLHLLKHPGKCEKFSLLQTAVASGFHLPSHRFQSFRAHNSFL